jgi:hypothetical protein
MRGLVVVIATIAIKMKGSVTFMQYVVLEHKKFRQGRLSHSPNHDISSREVVI